MDQGELIKKYRKEKGLTQKEVAEKIKMTMNQESIFAPHELKTIEVDVEKKIFRVNGEDFGKDCTGFEIACRADRESDFFTIHMRTETEVVFASYNQNGEKTNANS